MGNSLRSSHEHLVGYDFTYIAESLDDLGYRFAYKAETDTTMSDALDFGMERAVVVADHQTSGKGREGRNWYDLPGQSVLMTVVEPWGLEKDPQPHSFLPEQYFAMSVCQALQEVTANPEVKIRWPNDLTVSGKKVGGILIEEASGYGLQYPKLFGVGINVFGKPDESQVNSDYGVESLEETTAQDQSPLSRQQIVVSIMRNWADARVDLKTGTYSLAVYEDLWRKNAALIGREVTISGIGDNRDETAEGLVLDSPLGDGIIVRLESGEEKKIVHFFPESKVRIRSKADVTREA